MENENMKNKITIILLSITIIIILALWFSGAMGLWMNGISYIAHNTKEYNDEEGYLISEEYTISIDLNDIKSSIGEELYNDGESKIYISWIENTGSSNSGGYTIGFRGSGRYSLNGAFLVSGARHETGGRSFRTYMTAKMVARYKNKSYYCNEFGTSGLNYKDGDEFSFYIFPSEAYDNGEVSLNENDIVELSIKNLYKNIWTRN